MKRFIAPFQRVFRRLGQTPKAILFRDDVTRYVVGLKGKSEVKRKRGAEPIEFDYDDVAGNG